jgi:RNA polymerase sigma-70 factor (ECF subfamily)
VEPSDVESSDEALCRRVAGRDDAAFDLLVARYQQRAYRLAWSISRDGEEARDLAQEAFIRLYQAAGSFDGRAKFSTWFYRIVVNVCLDQKRKRRWWQRAFSPADEADDTREPLLDRLPAPFQDPVEGLDREQAMKRLWAAMQALSPQQRGALTLQLEGLATPEIAQALGCSEATVRVHVHRALAALRKLCIPTPS